MNPETIHYVSTLVSAALCLGLMVLCVVQGLREPVYGRFFLTMFSLFVWNVGLILAGPESQGAFGYAIANVGTLIFFYAIANFVPLFLGLRRPAFQRIRTAAGWLSAVGIVVYLAATWLAYRGAIDGRRMNAWTDYILNLFTLAGLGYGAGLIFYAMAQTSSARFRNRLYFFVTAVAVGFVAASINLALKVAGHPEFPAARIGMIIALILSAYSILARQTLRFEVAMQRAFGVLFSAGLCVFAAIQITESHGAGAQTLVVAVILLGVAIWMLPDVVVEPFVGPLRRFVAPERFGPERARLEFSTRAAGWTDRDTLAAGLLETAPRIGRFERPLAAFRDADGLWRIYSEGEPRPRPVRQEALPQPWAALARWPGTRANDGGTQSAAHVETLIVEDLERAADRERMIARRLAPDPAAKAAAASRAALVSALNAQEIDLAVSAVGPRNERALLALSYSSDDARIGAQSLASLEALAAESFAALQRIALVEQIRRSERLAAVGEMASAIAHEIKNPLSAIRGAAQALESSPANAADSEMAGIIREEASRLDGIINEFLSFSREPRLELAPVDLAELVRKTLRMCRLREDFARVRCEIRIGEGLGRVMADEEKLHQTLLNLLGNAADAMGGEGEIVIAAHADGAAIALDVADSGPGISFDSQQRLFEPFFTTKSKGTGLGLAISRRILEAHGGALDYIPGADKAGERTGENTGENPTTAVANRGFFRLRLPIANESSTAS